MIIYNGKNLAEFGVSAIGRGTYGTPARDIEQVHVPGLNGDVLFDSGGYENVTVEYPDCCIDHDFPTNFASLRYFLLSNPGYHRLEDSYATEEFRMAEIRGPISPDVHTGRGNRSGTFTLSFNCKPQRFLKEGEEKIEIEDWENIKNEWMPSKPIIIVKPGGNKHCSVWLDGGGEFVAVTDSTGYDDMLYEIDMSTGVAVRYREGWTATSGYNAASSVSGDLIEIPNGESTWRLSGNGTPQAWVKPMWWRV